MQVIDMNAVTFDTHECYNELKEVGFNEQQAEAIARLHQKTVVVAIERARHEYELDSLATKNDLNALELATRRDLKELEQSTKREIKDLELKIEQVRSELKRDIEASRLELKRDIEDVRLELKRDVETLRLELKKDLAETKADLQRWVVTVVFGVGLLQTAVLAALLLKLVGKI
jgi:hypothetical protein